MSDTNINSQKTVKSVTEAPFKLTPAQKRQTAVRMNDLLAAIDQYNTPELEVEWNAKFERLSNMIRGIAPYEEVKFSKKRIVIKDAEPTYKIKFFAPADMIREAKWSLAIAFDMLSLPQGKNDERFPGLRRFSIEAVTRAAATEFMSIEENKFFTHFEVYGEAKIEKRGE